MTTVNITINGQKIAAQSGQTVLQAARAAGIDVPVLCEHPALGGWGACRICLVEIAKQRGLQPACTFPISEGMEIFTETEKVVQSRKFVLELLFSERNHFCMYCQMSGDCELQDLAYRYGLDHWIYNRTYQPMAVDATRQYFIMEPNRCILCRRCVRACSDIVANHTLGVRERGAKSMIIADHDVPFGDSSCVECGTCLHVCPTGALIDRRAAYGYRDKHDVVRKPTTCTQCSIGCAIDVVVHDSRVLAVEGRWAEGPTEGLLCKAGRFEPLYDARPRIKTPMVRRDGRLEETGWDQALNIIAEKLRAGPLLGVAASNSTTEALQAFAAFIKKAGGVGGRADAALPALGFGMPAMVKDLLDADFIIVADVDPLESQRVAGYFIKRALDHGARLAVIDDSENSLTDYATLAVGDADVREVFEMAQSAQKPIIVYGPALSAKVQKALQALGPKASTLGLEPASNSQGAAQAGLSPVAPGPASLLYLLAGDLRDEGVFSRYVQASNGAFVVVQGSRVSALVEHADIVLPAPFWAEQEGHITNLEGKLLPVRPAVAMPASLRSEAEALRTLAAML